MFEKKRERKHFFSCPKKNEYTRGKNFDTRSHNSCIRGLIFVAVTLKNLRNFVKKRVSLLKAKAVCGPYNLSEVGISIMYPANFLVCPL